MKLDLYIEPPSGKSFPGDFLIEAEKLCRRMGFAAPVIVQDKMVISDLAPDESRFIVSTMCRSGYIVTPVTAGSPPF